MKLSLSNLSSNQIVKWYRPSLRLAKNDLSPPFCREPSLLQKDVAYRIRTNPAAERILPATLLHNKLPCIEEKPPSFLRGYKLKMKSAPPRCTTSFCPRRQPKNLLQQDSSNFVLLHRFVAKAACTKRHPERERCSEKMPLLQRGGLVI